jgi:glycosyltransferase involved in cell wall biosynthesis
MECKPRISVISPSKNTGRFAKETIESILAQTYSDWEHIVVDGVSVDETMDVIRGYSHIRWISEADSGPDEAFRKGLGMAKGEYVMFCGISDGYLDRNWFRRCVDILVRDSGTALVWGFPQYMSEDGVLGRIAYDHFFEDPPPQSREFIYFWLKTHFHYPEGNFCVRKNVMEDCYPLFSIKDMREREGFLSFNYKFNTLGYLPHFIPVVANYGRIHHDAGGQRQLANGQMRIWTKRYHDDIERYTEQLMKGKVCHQYRDGNGNLLSDGFDLKRYRRFKLNPPYNEQSFTRKAMRKLNRILPAGSGASNQWR